MQSPFLFCCRFGPRDLQHVNLFCLTNWSLAADNGGQCSALLAAVREGISLVPPLRSWLAWRCLPHVTSVPVFQRTLRPSDSHQPDATPVIGMRFSGQGIRNRIRVKSLSLVLDDGEILSVTAAKN